MASDYDLPEPGARAPGIPAEADYELPPPGYGAGPQPTQPATYNGEDLWLQEQQAEHGPAITRTVAQQAEEARRAQLGQDHGVLETITSQAARGVLDAFLAPGALLGAGAQSIGETVDSKWLSDFGRDLGRASSGKSAMQALGYVFGGGGQEGADLADNATRNIEEQEEARPMLSTVSRMAGQAMAALSAGAGAAGESGAAANIIMNAAEGASAGAQNAYERSASLRDVLSSAAVSGILGGSLAGAAEGAGYLADKAAKKAPDLAKVFGSKLQEIADVSEIKSVAGGGKKFWKQMGLDEDRISRVADKIRAVKAEGVGEGDAGMLDAIENAKTKAANDLTAVEEHLNKAEIKPDFGTVLQKVDEQVAKLREAGTGSAEGIANRIESEIAPLKRDLAIREIDPATGAEVVTGYNNPTMTRLRNFKTSLGNAHDAAFQSDKYAAKEIKKLWGSVAQSLDDAADAAGPGVGKLWRRANETYSDLKTVGDQLGDQIISKRSNRWASPSDYGTAIGAGLLSMLHSGNPIAAAGTAIATAGLHHFAREGGRAVVANLANRFSRVVTRMRVPPDVGPEMTEVLEHLAKTKSFINETAARAGNNPTAVAEASDIAKNVAAGVAAKKAGTLDLSNWAEKPLNPMQKVLYRGRVLDKVSQDLSDEAARVADMAPQMPTELDARRVARLTRDAEGPEAIGGVQQSVASLIDSAPPTPTGYATGTALRQLAEDINTADLPAVMTRTHAVTRLLDDLSAAATDQPSKDFAQRAMVELQSKLGSDAFGQAGKEYAAMTARPSQFLENLYNKDALREVLRVSDNTEELSKRLLNAQQQIADAHVAAFKLSGQARPPDLSKAFQKSQKLFRAGQEAVTLDGRAMGKVFDAANRAGVYAGDQAYLHTTDVGEHTVRDTVGEKINKLAPVIKEQAGVVSKRYNPYAVTGTVARRATVEDPHAQYEQRMQKLNDVVNDPQQIKGGMFAGIGPDVGGKLAQLLADMPKPTKSLMGPAGSQLSSEDLRLSNAMWEATTKPLSVFDDFARGSIDYDKVNYAWKQYPGLQEASQAGTLDLLTHELSDEERGKIPQPMITQLDNLLGFGGRLQESLDRGFSSRMSALYQPEPNKPQPGGTLETPKAEPTFTQRLSGVGT